MQSAEPCVHLRFWLNTQLLTHVLYISNRDLQEVPKATQVKNDKCEEMQQDSNVTLQSVKDQPQTTDNNSNHNKVIQTCEVSDFI